MSKKQWVGIGIFIVLILVIIGIKFFIQFIHYIPLSRGVGKKEVGDRRDQCGKPDGGKDRDALI